MAAVTGVAARAEAVRDRIARAGGGPEVAIVAVTKGFGSDAVAAAIGAGLTDVGENYAQELLRKQVAGARWHFLGVVQRNKVQRLAPLVHLWQGLDRHAAGEAVARHAPGARVLVEVNVSGLAGRGGCRPEETGGLVDSFKTLGLDVRGLMGIASADEARRQFRLLAELGRELHLSELSMGMSDDLEVAVEEGSTMVRVGRALFGARPAAATVRR